MTENHAKVDQLYTFKETCEKLHISSSTLNRLMKARKISYVRIYSAIRFTDRDIEQFCAINSHTKKTVQDKEAGHDDKAAIQKLDETTAFLNEIEDSFRELPYALKEKYLRFLDDCGFKRTMLMCHMATVSIEDSKESSAYAKELQTLFDLKDIEIPKLPDTALRHK